MRALTKQEETILVRYWTMLDEIGFERWFQKNNKTWQVLAPIVGPKESSGMFIMLGTLGLLHIPHTPSGHYQAPVWYDCSCDQTKNLRRNLSYKAAWKIIDGMQNKKRHLGHDITRQRPFNYFDDLFYMNQHVKKLIAHLAFSENPTRLRLLIDYGLLSEARALKLLVQQTNKCLELMNLPGACKIVDPKRPVETIAQDILFRSTLA